MLCRVSVALGKGLKTLGKAFAECHTRQRSHDKISASKAVGFAECQHSVKIKTKKSKKNEKKNRFSGGQRPSAWYFLHLCGPWDSNS